MISEVTVEKKFQSRAFLILPMSFNVAGILGPSEWNWRCKLPSSCRVSCNCLALTSSPSDGRMAC